MKKIIFVAIILIVILVSLHFRYQSFLNKQIILPPGSTTITIESGESVDDISNDLLAKNFISNKIFLKYYLKKNDLGAKIKAGAYEFSESLNVKDLIGALVRGEVILNEYNVQVIEGWTISDIDNYLSVKAGFEAGEFLNFAKKPITDWPYKFDRPSFIIDTPKGVDFEGYFFPDTYRVFKDATIEDISEKLLFNMDKKFTTEMREKIEKQGKTIHEILTLASIIEKEVNNDKDRAIVSGILNKRLDISMALQVDSTINYITGKNDPGAKSADLEIDSPYNTYKYRGLPPGPICSPGLAAIKAAIYPEDSPYLYYLNRQDTGETIFSKTYDEHLANKRKYLK